MLTTMTMEVSNKLMNANSIGKSFPNVNVLFRIFTVLHGMQLYLPVYRLFFMLHINVYQNSNTSEILHLYNENKNEKILSTIPCRNQSVTDSHC